MVFREDHRRPQYRNGAPHFAAVQRFAISLFGRETTNNRSSKNKRLHCALDPTYLLAPLHTVHS